MALRTSPRGWIALLALALLLVVGARSQCRPQRLHGVYVTPEVIHTGERARAFVSTSRDQVDLTIRDLVRDEDVHVLPVDGRAQVTARVAYRFGAGWSRSERLPALDPGMYHVSIPYKAVALEQAYLTQAQGQVGFVAPLFVRPSTPASVGPVLLVYDTGTIDAYNHWGGRSYYTEERARVVSSARPGFDRKVFAAFRRVALELESLGHACEFADADYVEEHPEILDAYRLVILMNKAEYTTRPFREALQAYFDGGGRILAIGVEFSVFQTRREGDRRVGFKFVHRGVDPVLQDADPDNDHLASYEWARVGEPATLLFGTSYWLGGAPGFETTWTVHRADHWLWEGTSLDEGDPLSDVIAPQLIDGTLLRFEGDLPFPDEQARTLTPDDFLVLASVPTANARPWWCWLGDTPRQRCVQPGWGVIGIRQQGRGVVLVIPDYRWIRDEVYLRHPAVRTATRNALRVLAAPDPVDGFDGYALD